MYRFITIIFLLIGILGFSQEKAKKVISLDDFAVWNILENPGISPNGKIITYEVNPQKGDGKLIINHSGKSDTIQRGAAAVISPGNDFVVFKIEQPEEKIRKAKLDKIKKEEMPADSVGIFVFKHDSLVVYPDIISFKTPEEESPWVALMLKQKNEKDSTQNKSESGEKEKKQPGNKLVLFDAQTADTLVFNHVTEYFYSKEGQSIYFISEKKDSVKTFSEINRFDTYSGNVKSIFNSEGWVKSIVSDEIGAQYAFLHSPDTIDEKVYKLFYGNINEGDPDIIVDSYTDGIPIGWSPSEYGDIYFSENGLKLYFGTAKSPEPEPKDSILEEEIPKLDIWHWQDKILQPQQKVDLKKEKERTYLAVYHIDLKRYIQLADLNVRNIRTIKKGNSDIALGSDDLPYLKSSSWTGKSVNDFYLVDVKTGIKRLVLENKSYVRLSPGGKYIVWYEESDSSFYAQSVLFEKPEKIPLTKMLPVSFYNELHDMPSDPSPYGIAGWAEEDRFVYIYDRYDIWKTDPSGIRVPANVTKTFGRRNKTRLRYVRLDKEEEFIPSNKYSLLHAFDERTMSSGFFKASLNNIDEPELLIMDKYSFSTPIKAKYANELLWSKQDVETYPDIWISNIDFRHSEKISNINPQQKNYIWPTVELVSWTSFSGENLQGLLYKPENLDPAKKYPMVVYFYERSSEGFFSHYGLYPSRSTINRTFYTSNGYLVFVPDITYKTGYPGQSAYNAVVSGVNFLINTFPFIDKENIGLQGQSWGGYQTAYIITQTDMFAAAMGGAIVSNMTSAYGGIRWGTGMSRMFQYEHTQSRIGGTLWEKPLLYLENSPLFHAPKIKTPLLMMHNDEDTAVPWYQGIELFVAMRRLNKPAWLLTYNGEPHNLKTSSWANRMDLSKRMFQFFNYYLKSSPMPEWMKTGVPAIEKGKNLGYD